MVLSVSQDRHYLTNEFAARKSPMCPFGHARKRVRSPILRGEGRRIENAYR
jgi:hypothetical protein